MAYPLIAKQTSEVNLKRKRGRLPALAATLIGLLAIWWLTAVLTRAQGSENGITRPASGDTISGVITVTGTAVDQNYLRYELAFRPELGSNAEWVVFAEGNSSVISGTLAIWDTTVGRAINAPVWPDGRYSLRLRVVRTDYNYNEYFATNLSINNNAPPTPTPTITPTLTLAGDSALPQGTPSFIELTPIPSLTPFPTPTPLPTPDNAEMANPAVIPDEPQGLLGQASQISLSSLSRAFWRGATWAGYAFAALLLYLLLRTLIRFLWRRLWHKAGGGQ